VAHANGKVDMTGIHNESKYLGNTLEDAVKEVTGAEYAYVNDLLLRYQRWAEEGVIDLADTALDGNPEALDILTRLRDEGFFDELAAMQRTRRIAGSSTNDT